MMLRTISLVFALTSVSLTAFAEAARSTEVEPVRPGVIDALRQWGLDLHLDYVSETATNLQGGDKERVDYADQWTFSAAIDLQKVIGVNDARVLIALTDRNGRNLSADATLGSLQEVQEIYGRGQTWHWSEFAYDQSYLSGRVEWKIGRLVSGEGFADFSCEFMNLALCGAAPGNIAVKYWYNWPVSQWGTRLKVSSEALGYLQLGAFEFNPRYLLTKNGLTLGEPGSPTGVLVPFEIGWQPLFAGRLRGSYKVGGWYNSSVAPDAAENRAGQSLILDGGVARTHPGEYGEYINFKQRLSAQDSGNPSQGLSVFFNATFADRRTSTLDSQIAAGILYSGPFRPRPHDAIGLAWARTHVNSRIANAEALINDSTEAYVPVQGAEHVVEFHYSFEAARWLQLRPSVQYIYRPGGISHRTDDVIAGLRVAISL